MIEPVTLRKFKYIFSSRENFVEYLRRFRYKQRKHTNPRNLYTVNQRQYESYYKFSIVRHPLDRAYSWYNNVMRDEIHRHNLGISKDVSFKQFFLRFAGKGMLRPQLYWLQDFSGDLPFDFIGKFENLVDDFEKICRDLNIMTTLPHKIKGSYPKLNFVDDEIRSILKKYYSMEAELFGYEI